MILADSRQFAIRRSLLPVLSTYFYKIFTHPVQQTDLIPHSSQTMDTLSLNGKEYPPGKWLLMGVSIRYESDTWEAKVHGITKDGEFFLHPSECRVGTSYISQEEEGVPGSVVVFRDEEGGRLQAFYLSTGAARLLTVRLYLFLSEIISIFK